MGSQEWNFLESDILVPAANVAAMEEKFQSKFQKGIEEYFRYLDWEVQWDCDEEATPDGQTSLVGLSTVGEASLGREFEEGLLALAPYLEDDAILEFEDDCNVRLKVIVKNVSPDAAGSIEYRRLCSFHVDLKDPADVLDFFNMALRNALQSGISLDIIQQKTLEASCEDVVES